MADDDNDPAAFKGPEGAAYIFGQSFNQYRWYSMQAIATESRRCRQRALEVLSVMEVLRRRAIRGP